MSEMGKKVTLVVGAGPGTGAAISERFARAGHVVVVTRRRGDETASLVEKIKQTGGVAYGLGCDARNEQAVMELVEKVERDVGPIQVAVHNIGPNIRFLIRETTVQKYYKVWEMAALSAFLVGREVAKSMVPRGEGTILFTGATASVRGGSGFAAFAGAMHAKRALSQSMARELGPKGIHVAHVVIDGVIDTELVRERFSDVIEARPPDGILNPADIAETYYQLHRQPRSSWTYEIDLRPWVEPW